MIKFCNWLNSVIPKPTSFYILVFLLVAGIIVFLDALFFQTWEDWKNVLVEAHGLVFDLLVFGIILTLYDRYRQRKERIERYREEIDDYRGWDEKEAAYRIAGNIRRLNREGVGKKINLTNCNLKLADLQCVKLNGSLVVNTSLENTKLINADLVGSNFVDSILQGANLSGADLSGTNLCDINLSNTVMYRTNLCGAIPYNAIFANVDLVEANLHDCDVTYEQLASCRSLYGSIGIPSNILSILQKEKPELFVENKHLTLIGLGGTVRTSHLQNCPKHHAKRNKIKKAAN
ncbi:MAG: pentapeptide repeat-containing protein [Saprospiraceae bacterium]|jgi:uncharacterized protein YjbI with pentapeptide repeats|nr:pentapeptide repeat-containing protein [Saprospiraceae bacterium]